MFLSWYVCKRCAASFRCSSQLLAVKLPSWCVFLCCDVWLHHCQRCYHWYREKEERCGSCPDHSYHQLFDSSAVFYYHESIRSKGYRRRATDVTLRQDDNLPLGQHCRKWTILRCKAIDMAGETNHYADYPNNYPTVQ